MHLHKDANDIFFKQSKGATAGQDGPAQRTKCTVAGDTTTTTSIATDRSRTFASLPAKYVEFVILRRGTQRVCGRSLSDIHSVHSPRKNYIHLPRYQVLCVGECKI
jgi:hypothetical protein